MSSTVRETALDHISTAQPVAPPPAPEQGKALANGYGCDVFNTRVMRQRLPREVSHIADCPQFYRTEY